MTLFYEDYESLEPGHCWFSAGRTIAESDIMLFAGLTGDFHSLHTNAHVARDSDYAERIAHGYLTASIASGLVYRLGLDEAASYAILNTQWKFTRPVKIGDTIQVRVILVGINPSKKHPAHGVVSRRYDVENQHQEIVAIGDIAILCRRRPPAP